MSGTTAGDSSSGTACSSRSRPSAELPRGIKGLEVSNPFRIKDLILELFLLSLAGCAASRAPHCWSLAVGPTASAHCSVAGAFPAETADARGSAMSPTTGAILTGIVSTLGGLVLAGAL